MEIDEKAVLDSVPSTNSDSPKPEMVVFDKPPSFGEEVVFDKPPSFGEEVRAPIDWKRKPEKNKFKWTQLLSIFSIMGRGLLAIWASRFMLSLLILITVGSILGASVMQGKYGLAAMHLLVLCALVRILYLQYTKSDDDIVSRLTEQRG
jgi:hypothetical protein